MGKTSAMENLKEFSKTLQKIQPFVKKREIIFPQKTEWGLGK
ncbi:hypothetical protein ACFL1Y_00425 [Patescibacteria group bacterium]